MHHVQACVQLILDRPDVDLRLCVDAIIDNLHLVDLILVVVQAVPGTLRLALEPWAPNEERQAAGHIHDIDHPLCSLLWLEALRRKDMCGQTDRKPAAEDYY